MALGLSDLPLPGKEGIAIEVSEYLLQIDLGFVEHLAAPKGRDQGWLLRHRLRTLVADHNLSDWSCGIWSGI